MRRRMLLGALAGAVIAPIRARAEADLGVIVPELPTGAAGTALRVLRPFFEDALGRPVFLDFRPGAGGIVGLGAGARAAPDGATLTLLNQTVVLGPWLSTRMDCVPADFAPLGQISYVPTVLLAGRAAPWRDLAGLLADARAGRVLTVPAPWDWRPADFAQALFLSRLKLAHRPLTGADRLALLYRGAVDLAFVEADRLSGSTGVRTLAVAGPARLPDLPDVPTFAEAGIDLSVGSWLRLGAPAATPLPIQQHLAGALRQILANPAATAALRKEGIAPAWLDGAAAAKRISAEYQAAGTLFSALGLNVRGDRRVALLE
ncbi:MAG: Bug family tripartite tricarboxylate transporter substrate binding protein [Acetobacteraceae bacterium]